jgi:hypothetical protein
MSVAKKIIRLVESNYSPQQIKWYLYTYPEIQFTVGDVFASIKKEGNNGWRIKEKQKNRLIYNMWADKDDLFDYIKKHYKEISQALESQGFSNRIKEVTAFYKSL